MAGSVNKVILVGNLGKDPEVRTTQDGTQDRQSDAGDQRDLERPRVRRAQGAHRVASGGDLQRPAGRRRRALPAKGRKIYVEGSLQTRKWTDQSGQERYTTEVVIGRFRGELTHAG